MLSETNPAATGGNPVSSSPKPLVANVESLLLPAKLAGPFCGRSEATWWRLHAAGKLPRPIKVGGGTLWRRADLILWVELACPDRATFEVELRARNGNGRPRQASR